MIVYYLFVAFCFGVTAITVGGWVWRRWGDLLWTDIPRDRVWASDGLKDDPRDHA